MKKSPQRTLGLVARKAQQILDDLNSLDLIPVSELAPKWKTSKRFISENLPIIKLGPKSFRVKLADAIEFQSKRTLRP